MGLSYLYVGFMVFAITSVEASLPVCKFGQFRLPGMYTCHDWLQCPDLKELIFDQRIGSGSTKLVTLAFWQGHQVAVSQLININFTADFEHGLSMLEKFNSSPYVVQLIGFCKHGHTFVTEYCRLGNATSVLPIFDERYGKGNVIARLKLCLNYALILSLLHDGPAGTRVMCDSNDLNKLLSQLLITDRFELVLNDMDALPLVDKIRGSKITCGNKELLGDFVAPEQKWPYGGPFRPAAMPGYDEKTDIWKAGDVLKHFVSTIDPSFEWVQFRIFNLIKSCKSDDPLLRPTAKYLVSVLEKILAEVSLVKIEL